LCIQCSDGVFKELERRQKEAERDRDTYRAALDRLEADDKDRSKQEKADAHSQNDKEAAALEKQLETKLNEIRAERAQLKTELEQLETETKQMDEFEKRFWDEYGDFELELEQLSAEQQLVKQQIKVQNELLERLKRTNVYDDAFHISYDGHFGTINGFRLGRLPSQPVDWQETNAALGQVALLLSVIAQGSGFIFDKYKLIPLGSFSKMGKKDDAAITYELYGSNDLSLGRLFWYRRFDTALVWLLQCVKEFGDYASLVDKRFAQRYPIKADMIGDVSIKLQFNQDAKWTKALKYMLTNLKFLLVWVSKRKR